MKNNKEFARGWKILILAFFGVATSAAVLPLYSFGTLMVPLQDAFGWSRSQLIATTTFSAFGAIFSVQLAGWLNNYYGMKSVAMTSFFALSLAFIFLSQLDRFGSSIWLLYASYSLITFAGIGTLQVTWTQLINQWFEKNRGLALAIILSGSGFMGMVLPTLLSSVMEWWGWRAGFLFMATLPIVITMPLAYFWLQPSPNETGIETHEERSLRMGALSGLSYSEGVRNWKFWIINISMLLISAAIVVMVINTIPMLQDKGFTSVEASKLFGVFGFSLVAGRVCVGFLIDRFWAPAVAFFVVFLSALGAVLFLMVDVHAGILTLSIALLGIGAGAEFDLAAFLVSRYCGLRDYARLFGLQMGVIAGGTSIMPLVVAFLFEQTGTYTIVMSVNVVFLFIAAFILLTLGRYPKFSLEKPAHSI